MNRYLKKSNKRMALGVLGVWLSFPVLLIGALVMVSVFDSSQSLGQVISSYGFTPGVMAVMGFVGTALLLFYGGAILAVAGWVTGLVEMGLDGRGKHVAVEMILAALIVTILLLAKASGVLIFTLSTLPWLGVHLLLAENKLERGLFHGKGSKA